MKTLRTFLLSLFVLFCFSSVYSQSSFRIGFQGGLAVSNLSYSDDLWQTTDQATRRGLVVAAVGEVVLSECWSLQIQPRYVQKGRKVGTFAVTGPGGPTVLETIEVFEKLDYVEIPLYVRMTFPMEGITPFLFAGPSVGFLSTAKLDPDPSAGQESGGGDIKGDFKSTDVAVDVGLGVEYRLSSPVAIFLEGTYSHGLVNIWAHDQPTGLTIRNYAFHFSLGMMFAM